MLAGAALGLCAGAPAPVAGQDDPLPFGVGEHLTYRVRVARLGDVGEGAMWVEGPVDVRGSDAWLLRFDFSARVGVVKAEDRTSSWIRAGRLSTLRFAKQERHPISRHSERVELFPDEQRWHDAEGNGGRSPSALPLDELSFMYFLRTLPLALDSAWRFDRHFDARRNPTLVRVTGREVVQTGAGDFSTFVVEMRVRDPRRYRGEGVIRVNVSDDACRLPVRMQSRMPVVGSAVLTLQSHGYAAGRCGAARVLTAR